MCTTSNRGPCAIARNTPVPSGVSSSSSWIMFCNEVDRALEPINKVKSLYKLTLVPCAILGLVFIFMWIAPHFGVAQVLEGLWVSVITYFAGSSFVAVQVFIYFRASQTGKLAFEQVDQLCNQHSSNGSVNYALKGSLSVTVSNSTGFEMCFIDVTTPSDDTINPTMPTTFNASVATPTAAFGGTTSPMPAFSASAPVPVPTATFVGTTTGPSLFEELSGGVGNTTRS